MPPVLSRKRYKGRLHVCSKSLVFDPDEVRVPLLKCVFLLGKGLCSFRRLAVRRRLHFRDIVSIRARTDNGPDEEGRRAFFRRAA